MKATIAILPGDGIGPEVCAEGRRMLETVALRYGHAFELVEAPIGGAAIDAGLDPLPEQTLATCRRAHAVLLGAVGGPKWSDPSARVRPEQGLLALRAALGVYANVRPVKPHPVAARHAPLKPQHLRRVDIVFVRELTGGSYFGVKRRDHDSAVDECRYTVAEIERVTRHACRIAQTRSGRLTHVDKANVLETSRLWRATVERVVRDEFAGIALEHVLVDSMAMHLITHPVRFDVVLTENLFGDILTDEAAVLCGSMGLLPSASLGDGPAGLYEPIHGSAPDIAGKGIANPAGALLSVAMLLRHSLDLEVEATAVERAVDATLSAGLLTRDLKRRGSIGTTAFGDAVIERLATPVARRVA